MDLASLLNCLVINVSLQWSVYVLSIVIKSERFFDLTGSFTFFLLAYLSYEWSSLWTFRQTIQTTMVCTWALRLGMYRFTRILKEGRDRRFNHIRDSPFNFFISWSVQGVWIFVTIFPTLLVNTSKMIIPIGFRDYVGWALWFMGFFVEVIADYQKAVFRNNPLNKGKFINSGLWRWSRHPNYCGEILVWFGLYISASSVLKGIQLLAVLCPLIDYYFLTKVRGIPPLEKEGIKRWGTSKEYQQYLKNTAVLFPFL